MLPNFLIIGAPKAATTWLADCLREHPDVYVPEAKELRYFCGTNYEKGLDWYEQHFQGVAGESAVGEASPSYLGSADASERIRRLLPDAKLIVSLRHPVEQAYSFYWHLMSRGEIAPSLEFSRFFAEQRPRAGYYGEHVARYLEAFSDEQLLILLYEKDIRGEPLEGLRRCQEFLGIDSSYTPVMSTERRNTARNVTVMHGPIQAARRVVNRLPEGARRQVKGAGKQVLRLLPARKKHEPLDRELRRELLQAHCLADIRRLEDLVDIDLTTWYAH